MEDRDHGLGEDTLGSPPAAGVDEGDDGGGGFSFPVLSLAGDAYIVPVYPVFGRALSTPPPQAQEVVVEEDEPETATVRVPLGRLLLEEREILARQRESSLAAPVLQQQPDDEVGGGDSELEGVPPESYCLWAPGQSTPASPRLCRKSGSTGSVLRWRRISERLVRRSQSDGKEKFVFLSAAGPPAPGPQPPKVHKEDVPAAGSKGDGRHSWSYYRKGSSGGGGSGRRRSYLPYKQELVGLFANVSGFRRSYHPF
ncbi:hypothetical protein GUJ93_ZPchr0001g30971 [Zizania palustris]|uniref:Uncharacterized protein n=1 Tax=Zizania palustris TaxID=103762 RepID=A0A8J5V9F4_ZIZPA|nr:hypothetical protein GUJ93_ZPchr0001g30971 [Zizania palustris]